MKLTVTVTTLGRASLFTTLASIYNDDLRPAEPVQVHVVADEVGNHRAAEVTSRHFGVDFFAIRPHRKWGDRNALRPMALGTHLAWIDDDDAYIPGGLALMTRLVAEEPTRLHSFGVAYPDWKKINFSQCTPSLVVPNDDCYPLWGDEAFASAYFEEKCVRVASAPPVRHHDITVVVRPHAWKLPLPEFPTTDPRS